MAIIWAGEAAAEVIATGEVQAMLAPYEIAGVLVAAGWAVAGGIAYWYHNTPPITSGGALANLVFSWTSTMTGGGKEEY